MLVHMEPDLVQAAIRRLSSLKVTLEQINQQLREYTVVTTWWQGPSAEIFRDRMSKIRYEFEELSAQLDELIQKLQQEKEEWLRAAERFGDGEGIVITPISAVAPVSVPTPAPVSDSSASQTSDADASSPKPQGNPEKTSEPSAPPAPPASSSHYTPRFDGSKPAPGMDSTYGKPGQLPLDAVVKSTPDNRDPNLYADVINQFAVGNNPRYAPDGRWTYCNTFAGDVARAMGHPFPTKAEWGINPRDRATIGMPDLWRYFTDPHAPIRAADQGWREIQVNNLQELKRYVNQGKMAVALTPGHIAVIRPNQDITDLASIRIAQAGAINANNIALVQGFGRQRLGKIRIFVHD